MRKMLAWSLLFWLVFSGCNQTTQDAPTMPTSVVEYSQSCEVMSSGLQITIILQNDLHYNGVVSSDTTIFTIQAISVDLTSIKTNETWPNDWIPLDRGVVSVEMQGDQVTAGCLEDAGDKVSIKANAVFVRSVRTAIHTIFTSTWVYIDGGWRRVTVVPQGSQVLSCQYQRLDFFIEALDTPPSDMDFGYESDVFYFLWGTLTSGSISCGGENSASVSLPDGFYHIHTVFPDDPKWTETRTFEVGGGKIKEIIITR